MIIFIHAGYSWHPWSHDLASGVGGSQLAAVKMAQSLSRQKKVAKVTVFADFQNVLYEEKLRFEHLDYYDSCIQKEPKIDLLVVSRYSDLLREDNNIQNVWLWCHDANFVNPSKTFSNFFKIKKPSFSILGLSQWHCENLNAQMEDSLGKEKIWQTSNGIDASLFAISKKNKKKKKVVGRFIYSSAMYRGLDVLLDCFVFIKKYWPEATLHVYSDLDSPLSQRCFSEIRDSVKKKIHQDGVEVKGWVSQSQLADAYMEADIWLYPTDFLETFCITALEAQASGTLCFASSLGALRETLSPDRAFFINEKESPEKIAQFVFQNRNNVEKREKAREWALQQTWDRVAEDWTKKINK